MTTYRWYRFEGTGVVLKKDSDWLKDLMKDKKGLFKHTYTPWETQNILIDRRLRSKVIKRVINGTFENFNINEEISI